MNARRDGARGRLILLHCVAQMPLAGIAWQALHHLIGFRRLGYDVWYVEDNGAPSYHPGENRIVADGAYGAAFLRAALEAHGFGDRWAYWDAATDLWHGLPRSRVDALYREADLLVNLCGATRLRDAHAACPVRLYVDTDPVYEQLRYAAGDTEARRYLDDHTHHATYGATIGTPAFGLAIDTGALRWRPTRPPAVLSLWPAATGEPAAFSTIATWENRGKTILSGGETYHWSKHLNFERFLDLPRLSGCPFTMAMRPPTPEIAARVEAAGWTVVNPLPMSRSLDAYAGFIAGSRGEFTVAKDIYARPNSGWFSDRSVCYLAAGRPVITQRTGAEALYPMGEGLLDYADMAEARDAVAAVVGDYSRHARAARSLAEAFFDSDRVLTELLTI